MIVVDLVRIAATKRRIRLMTRGMSGCPHLGREDEHCPCVDPGNENAPEQWTTPDDAEAAAAALDSLGARTHPCHPSNRPASPAVTAAEDGERR